MSNAAPGKVPTENEQIVKRDTLLQTSLMVLVPLKVISRSAPILL
jgi:hypothetical protein